MFIDKDSLQVKISGGNYVNLGDYIVSAKYQYPKLWAQDSGRNLKGKMTGTLIGIFPKITINFRRLSRSDLQTLAPILDSATQTVKYYDVNEQNYVEMDTYTGDWEVENQYILANQPFSISFIAREKR